MNKLRLPSVFYLPPFPFLVVDILQAGRKMQYKRLGPSTIFSDKRLFDLCTINNTITVTVTIKVKVLKTF